MDFHTAMVRCYHENASLVSILNSNEQAFVNSMVRLWLIYTTAISSLAVWNLWSVRWVLPPGWDREGGCILDWDAGVWHRKCTIHVCMWFHLVETKESIFIGGHSNFILFFIFISAHPKDQRCVCFVSTGGWTSPLWPTLTGLQVSPTTLTGRSSVFSLTDIKVLRGFL